MTPRARPARRDGAPDAFGWMGPFAASRRRLRGRKVPPPRGRLRPVALESGPSPRHARSREGHRGSRLRAPSITRPDQAAGAARAGGKIRFSPTGRPCRCRLRLDGVSRRQDEAEADEPARVGRSRRAVRCGEQPAEAALVVPDLLLELFLLRRFVVVFVFVIVGAAAVVVAEFGCRRRPSTCVLRDPCRRHRSRFWLGLRSGGCAIWSRPCLSSVESWSG